MGRLGIGLVVRCVKRVDFLLREGFLGGEWCLCMVEGEKVCLRPGFVCVVVRGVLGGCSC